jgi:N-acetylneuraminate synthase
MCGAAGTSKRIPTTRETEYLDALVRGVYARRDLPAGQRLSPDDLLLAIPLLKGQLSCRELIAGELLVAPIRKGDPLTLDHLDNPYSRTPVLRQRIANRGLDLDPVS